MEEFTLEKAISFQDENLRHWKTVLNEDTYQKVYRIVKGKNNGITNPYQICRGLDISTIVVNISMGNLELYED